MSVNFNRIILEKLYQTTTNELLAPEILPYDLDVVDFVIDSLKNAKSLEENSESRLAPNSVQCVLFKLDIERQYYFVKCYLKCRIKKIEEYALYLMNQLDSGDSLGFLAENEIIYLKNYAKLMVHQFKCYLNKLPPGISNIELQKISNYFNPDQYVFIRVLKDLPPITFEDTTVELTAGSCHLIKYSAVRHLILDSSGLVYLE